MLKIYSYYTDNIKSELINTLKDFNIISPSLCLLLILFKFDSRKDSKHTYDQHTREI